MTILKWESQTRTIQETTLKEHLIEKYLKWSSQTSSSPPPKYHPLLRSPQKQKQFHIGKLTPHYMKSGTRSTSSLEQFQQPTLTPQFHSSHYINCYSLFSNTKPCNILRMHPVLESFLIYQPPGIRHWKNSKPLKRGYDLTPPKQEQGQHIINQVRLQQQTPESRSQSDLELLTYYVQASDNI